MPPPEVFETARLILRRPRPEDAAAIFANYAQDAEVTRYLTWPPHTELAQTEKFVASCQETWEAGTAFGYVITLRGQDEAVGMVGLHPHGHRVEMGWVLRRALWGQGIMSEAVRPLVEWALAQPEYFRIYAVCDVRNPGSARVMEKAGMTYEGTLRRWLWRPGEDMPSDCLCYAVVK